MRLYNIIYVCIWYRDIYIKYDVCACIHTHIYMGTYMDNMSVCANRIFALRPFSGMIKSPKYLNIAPSKTCFSPAPNNVCSWRWLRILQKKLNCIKFTWYKNTEIYSFETTTRRKTLLSWGMLLFLGHTLVKEHILPCQLQIDQVLQYLPTKACCTRFCQCGYGSVCQHFVSMACVHVCVCVCGHSSCGFFMHVSIKNGQVWEYVLFQWIQYNQNTWFLLSMLEWLSFFLVSCSGALYFLFQWESHGSDMAQLETAHIIWPNPPVEPRHLTNSPCSCNCILLPMLPPVLWSILARTTFLKLT